VEAFDLEAASAEPGIGGSPTPVPLAQSLTSGQRGLITLTVMAATLMEVLDTSIVNVALPNMQGQLGATLDQIGWVATGYIISNVIILPLTGWLSDFFGRRMYLFYSVIVFTIASFGCGISRSLGMLVLMRVLQGIGGAAFLSTAQATLVEIYPPSRQGFAQAIFGMGVVMAPTLGPTVGGFLTDHFSWPWIFFINVPVGALAAISTLIVIPDSLHAGAKRQADWIGIGLLAVGLGSLQTILERGERDDWFQAHYIVALALCAVFGLLIFGWWELRPQNKNPAVDLRVALNRNLFIGSLCGFALGFSLYGSVLLVPQFLQLVQSHTAQQTGLLLIPGGLATVMVMPIIGQLVNRIDVRMMIALGAMILAASAFRFAAILTVNAPDSDMFFPLILRGLGIGLQFVPLSVICLGTLPGKDVAQGAGLFNLMRQLGGSFGIALLATTLDRRQKYHLSRVGEHLGVANVIAQDRLHRLGQLFAAHGRGGPIGDRSSLQVLAGQAIRQAYDLSFMDAFRVLGMLSLSTVVLAFFFKRVRPRKMAMPAH
jgi:MFS transporter, DHA2 family, multidrug resistance protein